MTRIEDLHFTLRALKVIGQTAAEVDEVLTATTEALHETQRRLSSALGLARDFGVLRDCLKDIIVENEERLRRLEEHHKS